ncbi:hypothetical protein GCM10010912_49860 [Paenibacillus albidus]|uniref:Uncharacterized protein n=2 Tax=Paenibacillus albidus TaxID=2041023 RepID=A0A917CVI1_9BACL|nr:hypothetical protein GCM10010912_49860 [Paenibacillus albidus]
MDYKWSKIREKIASSDTSARRKYEKSGREINVAARYQFNHLSDFVLLKVAFYAAFFD